MESAQCWIGASIHNSINCLSADTNLISQPYITYIFSLITLRRFNCDSNLCLFIGKNLNLFILFLVAPPLAVGNGVTAPTVQESVKTVVSHAAGRGNVGFCAVGGTVEGHGLGIDVCLWRCLAPLVQGWLTLFRTSLYQFTVQTYHVRLQVGGVQTKVSSHLLDGEVGGLQHIHCRGILGQRVTGNFATGWLVLSQDRPQTVALFQHLGVVALQVEAQTLIGIAEHAGYLGKALVKMADVPKGPDGLGIAVFTFCHYIVYVLTFSSFSQ